MFKIFLNTILGLVLIFIWSRFVNISEIFLTLSKVNFSFLIPIFLCLLLSPILRAVRLKIFLSEVKKINLFNLIFLNGASQLLNFFIPIRAGEIAKGIYLNTEYKLNLGKSIVWIFIDRFVDFLVVLLLSLLLVVLTPTKLPESFLIIVGLIFLAAIGITYLAVFQLNILKKIINFLRPLLIEKHIKIYFDKFTNSILESFSILDRHPKDLTLMVIITVLAYAVDAGGWYFTFLAIGDKQGFLSMYLGQLLYALTFLIPAAPGYVGSAEASGLLILSGILGINNNLASAMIVFSHITIAIFVLVFGGLSVFKLKLNLGSIFKKAFRRS